MTEIKTDILAALRTQEAALLAVLETVRQAIQTGTPRFVVTKFTSSAIFTS